MKFTNEKKVSFTYKDLKTALAEYANRSEFNNYTFSAKDADWIFIKDDSDDKAIVAEYSAIAKPFE